MSKVVLIDHLNRPIKMTNAAKASVWDAVWQPWGGIHSITGSATLNSRFPGQWYQAETGLHYNWHRSYDPSLGRYTQPDPLGFVDGPSVYAYAKGSPHMLVDRDGRSVLIDEISELALYGYCIAAAGNALKKEVVRIYNKYGPAQNDNPCDPPEGTQCYVIDLHDQSRPKNQTSYRRFAHYHILTQRKIPAGNTCQWQEERDKIGVGVFPILDLAGMLPCSAYGASRS